MAPRADLAAEAAEQVGRLRDHYGRLGRYEAIANLLKAVEAARMKIGGAPAAGLPAPRPYPDLARPGRLWVKAGRYWFAYTTRPPPVIAAVVFETADIPGHT